MQLALATKLKGVVIISSPGLKLAASMAQWRPAVPEETAMPCRRPARVAQSRSNSTALGPIERVSVWRTSTTASISRWVMSGRERGMGIMVGRVWGLGVRVQDRGKPTERVPWVLRDESLYFGVSIVR